MKKLTKVHSCSSDGARRDVLVDLEQVAAVEGYYERIGGQEFATLTLSMVGGGRVELRMADLESYMRFIGAISEG